MPSILFFILFPEHMVFKKSTAEVCFFGVFFVFFGFLSALGLHCFAWAFSSCGKQGLLFAAVRGLLIVVASLVAEHML